jgi:N-acetylglutamate synthase-like GNAT family acetyltransferase
VRLVPATDDDLPGIRECVARFRLDDENLAAAQFIVARAGSRIVAFGRIKPYETVYELACVGVLEGERGRGLGGLIVEELLRRFPARTVYITTDLPAYFERFGFRPLADPPPEIAAKLRGVCDRLRSGVIAMVRERDPRPPTPRSSP